MKGIDPSKHYGTVSEDSFDSIEEFKKAYEIIYEGAGWNSDAVIGMQCFLAETPGNDSYFDFMKCENLAFWTYPDRAYVVKLANLNVSDMLEISEDTRISKVYISQDLIGDGDPVAG